MKLPALDVAFSLGFRDIYYTGKDGQPTLATLWRLSSGTFEETMWLLDRGASPGLEHPFVRSLTHPHLRPETRPVYTTAHQAMAKLVSYAGHYLDSWTEDELRLFKLCNQVAVSDDCDCGCTDTESGCSPLLIFLKKHVRASLEWFERDLGRVIQQLETDLEVGEMMMGQLSFETLLRVLAYEAMGLRHTCCINFDFEDWDWDTRSHEPYDEDFEEIRSEDAELQKRLEELVSELTTRFELSNAPPFTFLGTEGLECIQGVVDELEGADLSQENRFGMENLGVRLYGPTEKPGVDCESDDFEHPPEDWDQAMAFWIEKFERVRNGDLSGPSPDPDDAWVKSLQS